MSRRKGHVYKWVVRVVWPNGATSTLGYDTIRAAERYAVDARYRGGVVTFYEQRSIPGWRE